MGLVATLAVALLGAAPLAGCGGDTDCSQDVGPPTALSTTSNPHRIRLLSSDLGISAVRWVNATTGESGPGTVQQVQECVFLLSCGPWSELVVNVTLAAGANTVHMYRTSDGCEWRDDYVITLN